ncbi:hypothetical protein CANINC_004522 [Pichia inconspicua]|uniref:Uncharacterized protein n=1 Tax=Pichia inconspicua TaxID=52247 RepID=A0A4T0WVH4_9ASCO|nr:hypothetical protein CANINC_004522 [[Candida] inconspicua]
MSLDGSIGFVDTPDSYDDLHDHIHEHLDLNDPHDQESHDQHDEAAVVARALTGIVDIGSNGIRFSISSKAPHHARIMPCIYKDRLAISLFDVQLNEDYDGSNDRLLKKPIPDDVIVEIVRAMKRFKWICEDFGVPANGVKVVATEATREASNSKYFITKIYDATGWKVQILSKEEECITGSFGVASSFQEVSGLFIDLGGGSTQLSWIISKNGRIEYSDNPVSLPYGAAALVNRMKNEDVNELFHEIKQNYRIAFEKIGLPQELVDDIRANNGIKLFCCGGGLRGLGHLLIANEPDYPIQTIINGFTTTFDKVENLCNFLFLKRKVPKFNLEGIRDKEAGGNNNNKIFCVSNRREQQLPAVGLLLSAAFESLPKIRTVHFSEGGVREGVLYSMFDEKIKCEDPIIVATRPYQPLLAHKYMELLKSGLPPNNNGSVPFEIEQRIIPALCNIAFVHCSYPKELQPTAALHVATSGIIAGCHGLSHRTRALIGIALCERWGAELPVAESNYYANLEKLVLESAPRRGERMIYWTKLCGKMMHIICGIHPGGNIRPGSLKFEFIENYNKNDKDADDVKNDLIITLPATDDIKYSYSIKSRALGFQKKIKKLNKKYSITGKVRVRIQHDNI